MADFPGCPSSERTMSVLPPILPMHRQNGKIQPQNRFCEPSRQAIVLIERLYCTIPQSLRDSSLYTREPLPRPIFHPRTIRQTARQIPIFRCKSFSMKPPWGEQKVHSRGWVWFYLNRMAVQRSASSWRYRASIMVTIWVRTSAHSPAVRLPWTLVTRYGHWGSFRLPKAAA